MQAPPAASKAPKAGKDAPLLSKAGLFHKELPTMMYGYGDSETPLGESVALVEDMVCDYVTGLVSAAAAHAVQRAGAAKLGTEDVLAVVRKDPARLARAKELIQANEDTKRSLKEVAPDNKALEAL